MLYNIVAIPSGVYRFIKEGRMAWPLTWVVIVGTLPGVFIGYYIRIFYLPDPRTFKLFVGCVLLYMGVRLFYEVFGRSKKEKGGSEKLEERFRRQKEELQEKSGGRFVSGLSSEAVIRTVSFDLNKVVYEFWGERFSFNTLAMFSLAFVVGIIGGTYGIGGGAIIAPFCVAVFHLPVYTVAGAALMGTFLTSIAGVFFYTFVPLNGMTASPDWLLGLLFGAGGFCGMYLGARCQSRRFLRYVSRCALPEVRSSKTHQNDHRYFDPLGSPEVYYPVFLRSFYLKFFLDNAYS
jgi:uncharacterized membrane protein YfcA